MARLQRWSLRARPVSLLLSPLNSPKPGSVLWMSPLVLDAIRDDEFHVFTHYDGSWRGDIEARFAAILSALDRAATR